MAHQLLRIGLAAAAIFLIWVGIDTSRRTWEMQRTRVGVRNLLGLRPWYNFFLTDERKRQNAIITHNFLAAASAILAGVGAVLVLLHV